MPRANNKKSNPLLKSRLRSWPQDAEVSAQMASYFTG